MRLLTAIFIVATTVCSAQSNAQPISFDHAAWNFGEIMEVNGKVSHTFSFTNTSSTPIIIERVTSDCGCTVPKYSSEPIRPGQKGTIEVVFDPANYNGRFSKLISVFCNNGKSRTMLTITGNVIPRERSTDEKFPYPISPELRADNLRAAFEYVENGNVASKAINIINTSSKKISISVAHIEGSGNLKVFAPSKLAPGEQGTITLVYDLVSTPKPVYGMLSDRVLLAVNGKRSDMIISTHAIAIDDFSDMDRSGAPECIITPVFHNFGKVEAESIQAKEVVISNEGKTPLIIRSVTPRSNTETTLHAGTTIDPGKSVKFSVSMKVKNSSGVVSGGLTLITNDPDRPMRDIRLAAEPAKKK